MSLACRVVSRVSAHAPWKGPRTARHRHRHGLLVGVPHRWADGNRPDDLRALCEHRADIASGPAGIQLPIVIFNRTNSPTTVTITKTEPRSPTD